MNVAVVGLGIQGNKRLAVAGEEAVVTVDPVDPKAQYQSIEDVPLDRYQAALVCTPDAVKFGLLEYLLAHGKHVLVEKPLLAKENTQFFQLESLAQSSGTTCYTAYNHRFEPHLVHLKELLNTGSLGSIYLVRFFYGNGTARDVRLSAWKDLGLGVLPDLGSHLLDMALFLLGPLRGTFEPWSFNCFENRSFDHVFFGLAGRPVIEMEMTLVSWRNTFTVDVFGELGTAHIRGLCKWGPSEFIVRKRVLPSGKPEQETRTIECADPTWTAEYQHFKEICKTSQTNLKNDVWISETLRGLASKMGVECSA